MKQLLDPRLWRVLFVMMTMAVCYLAIVPAPPTLDTGWDKSNHLLAFGALAFAASLSGTPGARWQATAALGLLAFGGLIEALQAALPLRQASLADLLADALGIVVGLTLARGLHPWLAEAARR